MTGFWSRLSPRERLLISVGGALFALFFLFQFVITPFIDWRKNSQVKAERAEDLYKIVAEASSAGGSTNGSESSDLDTPLRDVLSQTAPPNSISLNFVNTRPDGKVDASTASASPDDLFAWLTELERDYAVSVISADIAKESGDSGAVRAQLTFSR